MRLRTPALIAPHLQQSTQAGSHRLIGAVLAMITVSFAWGAPAPAAMPAVDASWRHFTSPHFELYSRNSDKPSRELLHNLELLRSVFLERLKVEERLHVEVTVYYFRTKREFQAYAPDAMRQQEDLAGFHQSMADRAIICLAPAEDEDAARQVIFHEYVHHLFHITERNPPLWYNEGTAEVLAGIKVDRDRVQIGTPLENSARYLREEALLSLDQLFSANASIYTDQNHTGVFYAESWALLHFWHFGDTGISREAVDRFLRVAGDQDAAAATDLRKLFQSCFGCDYAEMLRRLKKYIRTGSYRTGLQPMPKLALTSTYSTRAVPVDEITVRLAELAVRVNRSAIGKFLLMDAMKTRPDDPRSFETLGTLALLEKDDRGASERWEQALAAGSKNPAIARELALMEGRQWFARFDETFRLPTETANRMRGRLLRSIEVEPTQSAAYEMLAWVEGFAERPNPANINRVISHLPAMTDKKRALIGLSMVMLRLGKPDVAVTMLDYLGKLQLPPDDAHAFQILTSRLETDYPAASVTPDTSGKPAQTIAPPPSTPGLKTPSVSLPDDL